MVRTTTKVAVILAATTLLVGCSAGSKTPKPTDELASLRVLSEECATESLDECGEVMIVDHSGQWTLGDKSGKLEQGYFLKLKEDARTTKLQDSPERQSDCPTQHGGTESVYSWNVDGDRYAVRSCEQEPSPDDPLVKALENLWVDLNNAE